MLSEGEGAIMALSVPAACQEGKAWGNQLSGVAGYVGRHSTNHILMYFYDLLFWERPELNWLHFPVPQVTVASWDLGGTNSPGQCTGRDPPSQTPLSAQCIGLVLPTEALGAVTNTVEVVLLSKYWAAVECPCPSYLLQRSQLSPWLRGCLVTSQFSNGVYPE